MVFTKQKTQLRSQENCVAAPAGNCNSSPAELEADAVRNVLAVIEFEPDGTILTANNNFLDATEYTLEQIKGKHHSLLVFESEVISQDYRQFWKQLASGQFIAGQVRRKGRMGKPIWLQAQYIPIVDDHGNVTRVVKYAMDITDSKQQQLSNANRLQAIDGSMATIEFSSDGIVQSANDNFLKTTGYELDEIVGEHHRMFMPPEEIDSAEYKRFWAKLKAGQAFCGKYRRINKQHKEIWLEASYNPIPQLDGSYRIVKFASDITEQFNLQSRIENTATTVASSVSQMVETIREISENVRNTLVLAQETGSQAKSTLQSVNHLQDQSEKISDVTSIIQELSDQTNLLSLNASIEAVRAGESGKGFGVVAGQVKQLARQTSEATQNIESAVLDIKQGVKTALNSTASIDKHVANVTRRINTISASVEEQSATMRQLSTVAQSMRTTDPHTC